MARPARLEAVRERIVDRIFTGKVKVGPLNESALAHAVGTSRTPVREALLTLPNLVSKSGGRGFELRPLDPREVREIFPIIGSLECLALDFNFEQQTEPLLARLRKLNERLRISANPDSALAADWAWHSSLLSGCKNQRLLKIVSDLKLVARRYDLHYWTSAKQLEKSVAQHEAIVAHLEAGDRSAAKNVLFDNWMDGCAAIAEILQWQ
jgi:DNA-binding GntR family transcriptional regulator